MILVIYEPWSNMASGLVNYAFEKHNYSTAWAYLNYRGALS